MSKELTKQMLEEYGITNIENIDGKWVITRNWFNQGRVKEKTLKTMSIYQIVGKHKYTADKIYNAIGFSYKNKQQVIPLARVLYAWFHPETGVPANMDVDHINNISTDDRLENYQLLTREENIRKRFTDNPEGCWNQYQAIKKYHKE